MTLTEFCLLTMTIFIAVISVIMIVAVTRLLPLLMSAQKLAEEMTSLSRRLEAVSTELTGVLKDVRQVEARINGLVSATLDQVEPPLQQFSAVLSGIRAGWKAFARNNR